MFHKNKEKFHLLVFNAIVQSMKNINIWVSKHMNHEINLALGKNEAEVVSGAKRSKHPLLTRLTHRRKY
jgi:hypothetical protein